MINNKMRKRTKAIGGLASVLAGFTLAGVLSGQGDYVGAEEAGAVSSYITSSEVVPGPERLEDDSSQQRLQISYDEWKEGVCPENSGKPARKLLIQRGKMIIDNYTKAYTLLSKEDKEEFDFFQERVQEELDKNNFSRFFDRGCPFRDNVNECYGLEIDPTKKGDLTKEVQLLLYIDLKNELSYYVESGEIVLPEE